MCGIAGIHRSGDAPDDLGIVRQMLDVLRARGPDGEGICREQGLTLGHRRLAILDLSQAARQPMTSAGGRYVVAFNGEIYNYRELIGELSVPEGTLRTRSDTEILLLAWERWGVAALDRLVGPWAFALYDRHERRLWLVRDRFGEKPLFFHRCSTSLAFASSIPALLQAPWIPREIDPAALAEYLTLRYVVSPRTVLSTISKLPGGHLLSAGPDGVTLRRWYDPRFQAHGNGRRPPARHDLVEEFGERLVRASRRCLVSDVPVALLLSDGVDSNSIREALALSNSDVPCYTYRPERGDLALRAAPPKPAEGPGPVGPPPPTEMVVTAQERARCMPIAFSRFTEPVGDGAALATWLLIHHARPSATVFLSGSGGDELLGGYRLDQDRLRLAAIHRLAWLPEPWLRAVLARHTSGADSLADRRASLRSAPAHLVPAVARYLVHRPLPSGDLEGLFGRGAVPGRYLEVIDRLYGQCSEEASDLDRIQEVMLRTFLSENILSHGDSAAMGSSAELRLPFLDRDLVAFALRLPVAMRARLGPGLLGTKRILRCWNRSLGNGRGLTRRKRTFNYGSVRDLLVDRSTDVRGFVLESRALRGALPGLEAWVLNPPEFFRGPREGTLWALLTLGIWCETAGVR
jgi:asparagine synthase (glutamine-hydrolysing)